MSDISGPWARCKCRQPRHFSSLHEHYSFTIVLKITELNPFLTIIRKLSVMTGTLLYVFGSCECQSKFTEEMRVPLRPTPKKDIPRR